MTKSNNTYAWFLLILLSVIWGSSPFLIKKSLITLSPVEIGALRISSAALFLSPFFFKVYSIFTISCILYRKHSDIIFCILIY